MAPFILTIAYWYLLAGVLTISETFSLITCGVWVALWLGTGYQMWQVTRVTPGGKTRAKHGQSWSPVTEAGRGLSLYRVSCLFRCGVITGPILTHNARHTHPLSPAIWYEDTQIKTHSHTVTITRMRQCDNYQRHNSSAGGWNQSRDVRAVTKTAGHMTRPLIGAEDVRVVADWSLMNSDVSECLIFVEERRVSSACRN